MKKKLIHSCLAALLLAGCGEKTAPPPGPKVTKVERFGDYLPAKTRAVLTGVNKPIAIFGQQGRALIDHPWFGLEHLKNEKGAVIPSGLTIVDTSTGLVRRLTSADGLPTMDYNQIGESAGLGTSPFFDLTWLAQDVSFAAAAWDKVIRGQVDAKGNWSFKSTTLRKPGKDADAQVTFIAYAGGELFAGSDQGVAVLNPETLAVIRWVNLGTEGSPWVFGMSAGFVNGPAVAVLFAPENELVPTDLRLLVPGSETAQVIELPNDMAPTMVQGIPEGMLVGGKQKDDRGALYRVEGASIDQLQIALVADADELNQYTVSEKPFVPFSAAYDAVHSRLYVGGAITSLKPDASGRLLQFEATAAGEITRTAQPPFERQDPYTQLLPWEVDLLHVDHQGRTYIGGRQLCSEYKARTIGVMRIEEQEDGTRRLVRPFVTGVRSISVDHEGSTWLGLRDEIPGLTCDGFTVQQHTCRLRADGACEIYTPRVTADDNNFSPNPGAVAIAFGDPQRKEMAIATIRDATFVRRAELTRLVDSQINPGVSLFMTSAAWDQNGALWLGSEIRWDWAPPSPDNPIDWEKVNDRGPHGLGYIEFRGESGDRQTVSRYVRRASDINQIDIAGMPSNTVWDVIPLPGKQHALVALGIERGDRAFDHLEAQETDRHIKGGVAEVNGTSIVSFSPPSGLAWSDVKALAQGPGGTFYALDAEAGVVKLDLATWTSTLWAAPTWAAGERGRALAIDGKGNVAVATTQGLYVYSASGGLTVVEKDHGHGQFWTAKFMADGLLYAGADQGLVRVALDGATAPALGPASFASREPWALDLGCNGQEGCQCHGRDYCAYGLDCLYYSAGEAYCLTQLDPCKTDPGSEGCACKAGSKPGAEGGCHDGLSCECEGDSCACVKEDSCGGVQGCPCQTDKDCADGYRCQGSLIGFSCVLR